MRNNDHFQVFMTDHKVFGHLLTFHCAPSHENILLKGVLELLNCKF